VARLIFIGFGLSWIGYTLAFYGFSLVKGYDLSFRQIISPLSTDRYTGTWPPAAATDDVIFPAGKQPTPTATTTKPKKGTNPVTAV
jgi:hypothetical protein